MCRGFVVLAHSLLHNLLNMVLLDSLTEGYELSCKIFCICEVMDSVILGNILHVNDYFLMKSEMLFLNSIPAFKKLSYQSRTKTLPPESQNAQSLRTIVCF